MVATIPPRKCKHLGKHNPNPEFEYRIIDNNLVKVTDEKDIGVIIDNNLSFEKHISEK
jgi:hypothetical protein